MYMCLELWLPDAQLNSLWTDAMAWRMSAGLDNRLLYTLHWGLKVLWGLLWLFILVWYIKSSKKWGSWTVSPSRNYLWQAEHNNRVREIRVEVYEQFNSIGKFMTLPQCNFSRISNHTWSNPDDNLMHYGNFIITPNYMHMYILYFKKLPTLSWKLAMVCLEKTDIPASGPEHRHTALPFENSFITIGHVENLPILHHFV